MNPSRRTWFLAGLMLLAPLVLGVCMLMGASGIGLPDWSQPAGQAVLQLRFTRVLAGFVIGAALSCAGVIMQALLRNPLAEPYVLGVSSGAALGAAGAIVSGLAALSRLAVPGCAFVAASATLVVVYAVASEGGRPSLYTLILSGVMVSAVCSSLLMFLVSVAPVEGMHSILWWMLGNLDVSSYPLLATTGGIVLAGFTGIWLLAPELNALTLGHDMAHFLGIRVRLAIGAGLLLATLITAASVGVSGLIGFVGLIVPHVMRALVGPDHRRLIPAAALGGGAFLAACDAFARTVMAAEIPVGVITALVGGPFFIVLLRNRRKEQWLS